MNFSSDIELDLDKIKKLGKLRERENVEFRVFLKQKDSGKVDKIVHRLNREISDQIDCTKCGNCCAKICPSITGNDINRLSKRLNIPAEEVQKQYTEFDEEEGELFFKDIPCSFLKDKKCTIYDDRPEDCRSFPHIHKEHFTSRLWGMIGFYSICPIVFNVMERLKTIYHFK